MADWRKEFQYLRKMLSADELAYLFGQIQSIIIAVQRAEAEGASKGRPLCPDCRDLCLEAATKYLQAQLASAEAEIKIRCQLAEERIEEVGRLREKLREMIGLFEEVIADDGLVLDDSEETTLELARQALDSAQIEAQHKATGHI